MAFIPVARLNHAVLFVRDATVAADFYARVFGFEVVAREFGGQAVFMRSAGGDNHHDLGLFSVGAQAPRAPRGSVGLTPVTSAMTGDAITATPPLNSTRGANVKAMASAPREVVPSQATGWGGAWKT